MIDLWTELWALVGFSQDEHEDLRESLATIGKPVAAYEVLQIILEMYRRGNF